MNHEVQTDKNGSAIGFAFHDGSLDGICLAGQRVSLTISSTSNEQTTLRLEEVSSSSQTSFENQTSSTRSRLSQLRIQNETPLFATASKRSCWSSGRKSTKAP